MNVMCGSDNFITCTPEKWFRFMGSITNGYSPFNLLYKYDVEGTPYILHDPTIVPCSDPVPYLDQESGCSCTDCEEACLAPPEFEVDEGPFEIGEIDGLAVVMGLLFGILSIAFLSYVLFKRSRKKQGKGN